MKAVLFRSQVSNLFKAREKNDSKSLERQPLLGVSDARNGADVFMSDLAINQYIFQFLSLNELGLMRRVSREAKKQVDGVRVSLRDVDRCVSTDAQVYPRCFFAEMNRIKGQECLTKKNNALKALTDAQSRIKRDRMKVLLFAGFVFMLGAAIYPLEKKPLTDHGGLLLLFIFLCACVGVSSRDVLFPECQRIKNKFAIARLEREISSLERIFHKENIEEIKYQMLKP